MQSPSATAWLFAAPAESTRAGKEVCRAPLANSPSGGALIRLRPRGISEESAAVHAESTGSSLATPMRARRDGARVPSIHHIHAVYASRTGTHTQARTTFPLAG